MTGHKASMNRTFDSFAEMLAELHQDVERYTILDKRSALRQLATGPGLWLTIHYRFSRWVNLHLHLWVIRQIAKAFCFVLRMLFKIFLNCELPATADIGAGLFLPHPYNIVIHEAARLGRNCNLGHEVTVGWAGRGEKSGVPVLGDRVFIAPGAKVFGKITIGNDVAIGANAVVNKSLPNDAVAAGIPAKILSYESSKDFVICEENRASDRKSPTPIPTESIPVEPVPTESVSAKKVLSE